MANKLFRNFFTDILWPDFNEKEMIRALEFYSARERRFGTSKAIV